MSNSSTVSTFCNALAQRATILALTLILATTPHLSAQTAVPAPLPAQLAAAKTVFISNALDAEGHFSQTVYDQVYAAVQALNRFTIVNSPQQADLVLQFGESVNGVRTLHITDPKTNVLLWSVSEIVQPGIRTSTQEKYVQTTVNNLANDLETICALQTPTTH